MICKNKSYFIFLLVFAIICSSIFGQSIQELQTLQRLLRQSNSMSLQEKDIFDKTSSRQTELTNQTTLLTPKLKSYSKKGSWKSTYQYTKWLNETNKDTSVMELYGFIPDTSLTYFGYNIFSERDSIAFWQNLHVPDNYILGSGDEIQISLWGEAQLNDLYTINRDGNIYIERVGLLNLTGKSVNSAREHIENKFKQSFATLRGKFPSSFIEVTINTKKTINVHFVGEVNIPGIHLVHPFSSIITGLIQAGGVKTTGSLRNIKIIRNGEAISDFDLYNYILNGKLDNNTQLRENDIVLISVRKSTIEIDGAIHRKGIYESVGQETINQLINYSGGLKHNASQHITISRILPIKERKEDQSIIKQFLFKIDQLEVINAQDGDKIIVHSVAELPNKVRIWGQIKREGTYQYTENMNLYELFNLAGGLEDSIFIKTMHLDEVDLIRKSETSEYNETIKIDLQQHLEQNTLSEIKLKNNDLVVVRNNKNLLSINNVEIAGDVHRPGVYALTNIDESLQSVINRAGGLTNRAFKQGIKVVRDTLNVIWNDFSIALMDGDSIYVGGKPGVVEVNGEVYNPGLLTFSKGRSIKSYINSAGGIKPTGNKRDILIVYPNGDVKPNGWLFFQPKIAEGTTIIVNPKPEREPFSLNQFLRDTASIAASVAMIYYVVIK